MGASVHKDKGKVCFYSDNKQLEKGFNWAKSQALEYVFEGDLVGDWYEAALPDRAAFCMRDVSHQSTGGQVLGLAGHNKNMLLKFAQGIAESRDYCSFWEIDKFYRPAPVDYTSDEDFWYNLPANFDVLDACWRMYLWTGDQQYIKSSDFTRFYDLTVTKYVETWDKDGDGILERASYNTRRGIASYDEGIGYSKAKVMIDLIAIHACAYYSYASMLQLKGFDNESKEYFAKAKRLREHIRDKWWDHSNKRFFGALLEDGQMIHFDDHSVASLPIYYDSVIDENQLRIELDNINNIQEINVEGLSYIPGVFYRNGQLERAQKWLYKMIDPQLKRREYPEVSFSTLGYYAEGLMGVKPYSHLNIIETTPGLLEDTDWARLEKLPVFGGTITLEHTKGKTSFENSIDREIIWKARFRGKVETIYLDGKPMAAEYEQGPNNQLFSFIECKLSPGTEVCASVSD